MRAREASVVNRWQHFWASVYFDSKALRLGRVWRYKINKKHSGVYS